MSNSPLAVVFGVEGEVLTERETRLFREVNPLGFILFGRNCIDPEQVSSLVSSLREAVGRPDAPVLIDQEGGRVMRLRPPHWPDYHPASRFGELALSDLPSAKEAVRLNSELIGYDLAALGITVNCAPTIDLPVEGAHEMIGSRAYSNDISIVSELGRAACEGFLLANVMPVIKHLPGYGRAFVDSHASLPIVTEALNLLEETDFIPFQRLADMPWGMTAHVLINAVDSQLPSTVSSAVIRDIVRKHIGFHGVLITDDLSMQALSGTVVERVVACLEAGCDIALHCNGNYDEMVAIAEKAPAMALDKLSEIEAGEKLRKKATPATKDQIEEKRQLLNSLVS